MDILSKIKVLQGERGWTDYKLAQKANISSATLSSIFNRESLPKLETMQCICNAFGLTLSQFFLEDEKVEILSETEKEMLKCFRKLSPKQQRALIEVFRDWSLYNKAAPRRFGAGRLLFICIKTKFSAK